jgi:signal peptide peptidase SppA
MSKQNSYANIINAVCSTVWAIMPEKLDAILAFLSAKSGVGFFSGAEIEIETKVATTAKNIKGKVALLPLVGTISQRIGSLQHTSGGVSTDEFGAWFDSAVNDNEIGAIVIDVDSPGGNVFGVQELSQKIFEARGIKPILAVANSLMASAAYWIASAADEIIVSPSSEVGSIGVIAVHTEQSGAQEQAGFKTTVMTAGKYKGEANPYEPLGDDAKSNIESRLSEFYSQFTSDVARNRDVKKADVIGGFGQGRVVGADTAIKEGMADRVATFESVINRLISPPRAGTPRRNSAVLSMEKIRSRTS